MSLGTNALNFYSVPKLQNDGSNWVTYKTRLRTIIGAKGLMRHLEGAAIRPRYLALLKTDPLFVLMAGGSDAGGSSDKGKGKDVKPTTTEIEAYKKALEKVDEWDQKQFIVKQQIFSTISDSLLLHVQSLDRAHEVWTTVCQEFEAKTMMTQIDLRRRLQDTCCQDGDDICMHFDSLLHMKEELSGMGTTLEDADFAAIIMSSLPSSYDPVLSSMLAAARIAKKALDPHTFIAHITEKFDRRAIQSCLEKKTSDGTALFTTGDAKEQRARGSCSKFKKDGPMCPNCGRVLRTDIL